MKPSFRPGLSFSFRTISEGTHERFFIDRDRFLKKVAQKASSVRG